MWYKHGADRRSLEPRPTDGGVPAQCQGGSEDAEGPEAAPGQAIGVAAWPEDSAPGGNRGQRPAGHRSVQKWYETAGWGARVRVMVEYVQRRGMVFLCTNLLREWPPLTKFKPLGIGVYASSLHA